MALDLLLFVDGYLGIDQLFDRYVTPLARHHRSQVYVVPMGKTGKLALDRAKNRLNRGLEDGLAGAGSIEVVDMDRLGTLSGVRAMVICPLMKRYNRAQTGMVAALPWPKAFVLLSGSGQTGVKRVLTSTVGSTAYFRRSALRIWLCGLQPLVIPCHVAQEGKDCDSNGISAGGSGTARFSLEEMGPGEAMNRSRELMAPLKEELVRMGAEFQEKYIRSSEVGLALSMEAVAERADAVVIGESSGGPVMVDRSPYRELIRHAPCDIIVIKG
ncbi:MAG: universal stress protein [Methanosarcinales archaeon]|nr:universal stress protein [Methanosarcinales archaeon]